MALTSYSFENVSLLIDGEPVTGFWEGDDAIQIERNKDVGNPVVGVDGCAVVSRPVDKSVNITLTFSPNCPGHRLMNNKLRAINGNQITQFSISITDTGNGEGGSSVEATIIQAPASSFGENASGREWVIFANNWRENAVAYTS